MVESRLLRGVIAGDDGSACVGIAGTAI